MRASRRGESAAIPAGGLIVVLALLAVGTMPAAGEVVTITSDRDNTLFEDDTGSLSNGAGPVFFSGRNSQNLIRRALLRFDVASSVPSGAVVTDVILRLNASNTPETTPRVFALHAVSADWGEGASSSTGGGGAPAAPGDATWLHRFWPGSPWASAGGDCHSVASASQTVVDVGPHAWTGPEMIADVQAWVGGVRSNFGWLLVGDETMPGTARRFDSRENAVAANRPALSVTYTTPVGVPAPMEPEAVLGPCRPNPGTGPFRFSFSLRAAAHVTLWVADLAGRRVATILDREAGPGRQEVGWKARDAEGRPLAAGVYLYGLAVNGRPNGCRRWVLLR